MNEQTLALLMLFGILFFLMAIRVPIAFSLGISSMATALYLNVNLFAVFQSLTVSRHTLFHPVSIHHDLWGDQR